MRLAKLSYDEMTRVGIHGWWMVPLSGIAALITAVLTSVMVLAAGATVAAFAGEEPNWGLEPVFISPFWDNVLFLLAIAVMTPATLALVRFLHRRSAGTLHSVDGRLRWRWLAACFALGSLSASLMVITLIAVDDSEESLVTVPWTGLLGVVPLLLVLVPLQAAGEEYLVRGFMLQTFGILGRPVAVVGSAAVFAAMHGFDAWPGFIALFGGSVLWALLVIRTGGLEVSIAAHAASNLLAFLLVAAAGGLDVADDTSAADADWQVALILLGGDVVYAFCVFGLLR
jgi:membrane protease YdiL (CAAX protease family)